MPISVVSGNIGSGKTAIGRWTTFSCCFESDQPLTGQLVEASLSLWAFVEPSFEPEFEINYPAIPGNYELGYIGSISSAKNYRIFLDVVSPKEFCLTAEFIAQADQDGPYNRFNIPSWYRLQEEAADITVAQTVYDAAKPAWLQVRALGSVAACQREYTANGWCDDCEAAFEYRSNGQIVAAPVAGQPFEVIVNTPCDPANAFFAAIYSVDANNGGYLPDDIDLHYARISNVITPVSDFNSFAFLNGVGFSGGQASYVIDPSYFVSGNTYRTYAVYRKDGVWYSCHGPEFAFSNRFPEVVPAAVCKTKVAKEIEEKNCRDLEIELTQKSCDFETAGVVSVEFRLQINLTGDITVETEDILGATSTYNATNALILDGVVPAVPVLPNGATLKYKISVVGPDGCDFETEIELNTEVLTSPTPTGEERCTDTVNEVLTPFDPDQTEGCCVIVAPCVPLVLCHCIDEADYDQKLRELGLPGDYQSNLVSQSAWTFPTLPDEDDTGEILTLEGNCAQVSFEETTFVVFEYVFDVGGQTQRLLYPHKVEVREPDGEVNVVSVKDEDGNDLTRICADQGIVKVEFENILGTSYDLCPLFGIQGQPATFNTEHIVDFDASFAAGTAVVCIDTTNLRVNENYCLKAVAFENSFPPCIGECIDVIFDQYKQDDYNFLLEWDITSVPNVQSIEIKVRGTAVGGHIAVIKAAGNTGSKLLTYSDKHDGFTYEVEILLENGCLYVFEFEVDAANETYEDEICQNQLCPCTDIILEVTTLPNGDVQIDWNVIGWSGEIAKILFIVSNVPFRHEDTTASGSFTFTPNGTIPLFIFIERTDGCTYDISKIYTEDGVYTEEVCEAILPPPVVPCDNKLAIELICYGNTVDAIFDNSQVYTPGGTYTEEYSLDGTTWLPWAGPVEACFLQARYRWTPDPSSGCQPIQIIEEIECECECFNGTLECILDDELLTVIPVGPFPCSVLNYNIEYSTDGVTFSPYIAPIDVTGLNEVYLQFCPDYDCDFCECEPYSKVWRRYACDYSQYDLICGEDNGVFTLESVGFDGLELDEVIVSIDGGHTFEPYTGPIPGVESVIGIRTIRLPGCDDHRIIRSCCKGCCAEHVECMPFETGVANGFRACISL